MQIFYNDSPKVFRVMASVTFVLYQINSDKANMKNVLLGASLLGFSPPVSPPSFPFLPFKCQ